ncbi:MAG TPA: hypothetical protein VJZ00_13435 [Thermoanaerobaculia bacterium]|nr:hypothetical protein [Thermoanaerobaculia bacterium]
MAGLDHFVEQLAGSKLSNTERAVALLYAHTALDPAAAVSARDLAQELAAAGFPLQNVTRLRDALSRDARTAKAGRDTFRIRATAIRELEQTYGALVTHRPLKRSNSVLPLDIVTGTRGYIEKVALQLNASYDAALYDCCAVMCRRILETLIIEVYESRGRADELKGGDGNFKMFASLLSHMDADKTMNVGRNSMQALRDFKKLGDLSAHNRRFNANRDDIDRVRDGLRVAVEELVHLAGLA